MKLRRVPNRKVGNKTYEKWVLVPPAEEIEKLGWKDGEELEAKAERGRLVFRKAKAKDPE